VSAERPAPLSVTDWAAMLGEMRRLGVGIDSLGRHLGMPRTTLQHYAYMGGQPKHAEGERLIAFWCQLTERTRAELPTASAEMSAARSD